MEEWHIRRACSVVEFPIMCTFSRRTSLYCVGLLLCCVTTGCQEDEKKAEPRFQEHGHLRASMDPLLNESEEKEDQPPDDKRAVDVMFINGDTITVADILNPLVPDLEEKTTRMEPKAYWEHVGRAIQARIREEARTCLLFQQAEKGISESEWKQIDLFVDQRIRDIVNEQYGGRQARYEKALKKMGFSLEKARKQIRRDMAIQRYLYQNIQNKVAEPTRQELWAYFQQHKEEMASEPRRELLLIEIAKDKPLEIVVDSSGTTKNITAEEGADYAMKRLKEGDAFETVVKDCSTGIHAKDGGSWGMILRDSLRERYEPAVAQLFSMQEGETSTAIDAGDAFFIVKCGKVDPGITPDFKTMQSQLVQRYQEHQYNILVEELVTRLREQAHIFPEDPVRFYWGVIASVPSPTSNRF